MQLASLQSLNLVLEIDVIGVPASLSRRVMRLLSWFASVESELRQSNEMKI